MTQLPPGPALSPEETTFRWMAQPYELLDECSKQLGDTFTLRFGRFGTHVVATRPDDVQAVFAADRDTLHAGKGNALLEPILGKHSLLLTDGERHAVQRAMLQPTFRSEVLPGYARVVGEATRRRTAHWSDAGRVSVQETALEISKEVILRVIFGLDGEDLNRFSSLVHELMTVVATNATFDSADDAPLMRRFRAARGALDAALYEIVGARRRSGNAAQSDVLTMLVARDVGGEPLSDEEIRDQLVTMILAGHETTASSISWALLCLHAEPRAVAEALRELDGLPAGTPDERLAQLPYLQAVVLETIRLRPVIPVISRLVRKPFSVTGRTLDPGIFVTPCAYLAHRRPESFPDPERFRPERFLDRRPSPNAFFPFGGGARRCIGMSFALLEMQVVLGVLLRRFRFELTGDVVHPVRRAVTIVPSGGGRMQVRARKAA